MKLKKKLLIRNTKGNVISKISYESQDFEGRKYLIKSQKE